MSQPCGSKRSSNCGHPDPAAAGEGSLNRAPRFLMLRTVNRSGCDAHVFARFLSRACGIGMTALLLFCNARSLFAQEQSATSISQEVKDIFARCSRAVV